MQPSGAFVTVVGGPTTASGYTWWNVNFDSGADRWVVATYLAKSVALLPASTPIAASMTTSDKLSTLASLEAQVEALLAAIASLKSQLVAGGKCV